MSSRVARRIVLFAAIGLLSVTSVRRTAGQCGATTVTAPQGNGVSSNMSLSGDGRYLVFGSSSSNLVPGDTNNRGDVFVYDRQTCAFDLVSVDSDEVQGIEGAFSAASISDDGRYVAFASLSNNLVSGDTNNNRDIFVRDRTQGTTIRVSVTSAGSEAPGPSYNPEISADGLFVAFRSESTGLVAGDTNGEDDIFVRDLMAGTTERVSVASNGAQGESPGDAGVEPGPRISGNGRYVSFVAAFDNLVPGDTNGVADVFVRDRVDGTTVLVSQSTSGALADGPSDIASISADGRYVAFSSVATNLVADDTNAASDVFVRDLQAGSTSRVSLVNRGGEADSDSGEASISGDGRYVSFTSAATNLVLGDTNADIDIFVHDRTTGATRRVSTSLDGQEGNGSSTNSTMSDDGRFVAFETNASNVFSPDANGAGLDVVCIQWGFVSVPAAIDLVANGDFSTGLASWLLFATPDMTYVVANVVGGVLEYYRVAPPPGTTNQAVVFQQTTAQLLAFARIEASFDLGNSSTARKRISVLIHDADFTDLHVCTFWLAPGAPMRTYGMRSHTTKAWANATIAFYAASAGSDGGAYQLDNVALTYEATGPVDETLCDDPTAPAPPGGADSASLLTNGDFTAGLAPWGTFGQIVSQIAGGVFEFNRPAGTPSGVVLQGSLDAMATGEIMTATFDLGNSSTLRKRVTVLLHEGDFTDLTACTFWLEAATPLQTYRIVAYATKPWTNATVSVYPASVGTGAAHEWYRLDNVALQRTPSAVAVGTSCREPAVDPVMAPLRRSGRGVREQGPAGVAMPPAARRANDGAGSSPIVGEIRIAGPAGRVLVWIPPGDEAVEVQVSADRVTWVTLAVAPGRGGWVSLDLDFNRISGDAIYLRLGPVGGR
jgi:Tol biopolymer transport system component